MKSVLACLNFALAHGAGLNLLQIADWGGDTDDDPTWPPQLLVANGLEKAVKDLNADSILLLGDNFYNAGVSSSSSKRFKQTFENVYTKKMFGNLPFHVIAGNHDHYGNANAQVEYAKTSDRWNFPSLWYTLPFSWKTDSNEGRTLDIVMLDTVGLAGLSSDECLGCELGGPANLSSSADQWTWLENQLKASTADYLWVAGHYPIYSAGSDGTTSSLVKKLLPLLKQHGAHYISGHDHMAEHITYQGVEMFVNGMGAECCYGTGSWNTVPSGAMKFMISGSNGKGKFVTPSGKRPAKSKGGYTSMQFGDSHVNMTYHNEVGAQLYTFSVPKRSSTTIV